ncbi:helicase-exonuclease AddAB subunit AddB [Paenibacillus sp. CAU 1782]
MSLRLIIGRAGSGKSFRCLTEIREQVSGSPDGPPLILLVPEQATFQSEYDMLHGSGFAGTMRAQALSFRRLAFRVMQETGGTALVPIGDIGKHMLLYKLVHKLSPELKLFRGGAEQPGFMDRLSDLLTEWKRYGIDSASPGEIPDHEWGTSPLLDNKLHDLMLLYSAMEGELSGKYIDAEDYLTFLENGFSEAPSMSGSQIWVDGFHGFTPGEYSVLGKLIAHADVTVSLTLDKLYQAGERPHELDLFHPAAETCAALMELAEACGAEVLPALELDGANSPRFRNNDMLRHLERHYGSRMPMLVPEKRIFQHLDPRCGISLHALPGRRAEVETIARDMLRRAREDGLRWREMAVLVRNSEDYADYLSLVFQDFGIPYFVDRKEKALHHPLVEYIRSALETVLHGWHYDAVFRCVKTEMVFPIDRSLPREWFDQLENYCLAAGIDGWKWLNEASWKPLAAVSLDEDSEMEFSVSDKAKAEFEIAMAARSAIVPPLELFGKRLKESNSILEMCEALYALLDETDAADRLELWAEEDLAKGNVRRSRSHRQLWDGIMSLLDQLAELAGDQQAEPELFAGMVEAGLDSLKLAAVPPSLDQVLIGSLDRTRSGEVKAVYVLGANDGVIPMRMKEDGILTEGERDVLAERGMGLAPGAKRRLLDERFMIYNALAAPSSHLWISYAQADEEGKSLLPSELIRHVTVLFPGIHIQEGAAEPSLSMTEQEQAAFIVQPGRSLAYLGSVLGRWLQSGQEPPPFWWGLYNWYAARPDWQGKLALLSRSLLYSNEEPPLPKRVARELYGRDMVVSVSRMERFVSCPFQHFAIHGLKLRERKLYRLEAPDVGQLFHAAMSRLGNGLGGGWGRMTKDEIKAEARKTVEELAPRLQSQILLSSGRFQFIARKLQEIVAQAAVVLGEHARRAEFRPVGTEVGFGPGGTLPALKLSLPGGSSLEVIGRIDRVDAAETEDGLLLRVMDYKSSQTSLRLEEVAQGLSLQMLTYLDVLLTYAETWLGRPASPAGVLYFHVHNPVMAMSNKLTNQEAQKKLLGRYKMRGLLTADADIVRLMDGELESGYSEVLPVALKRDGGFYSSSSVIGEEDWPVLRNSVRTMIGDIGECIQEGQVSIEPYRLGDKTPCQFCHYRAVCQFDQQVAGNQYRKLGKLTKDEVWQRLGRG